MEILKIKKNALLVVIFKMVYIPQPMQSSQKQSFHLEKKKEK